MPEAKKPNLLLHVAAQLYHLNDQLCPAVAEHNDPVVRAAAEICATLARTLEAKAEARAPLFAEEPPSFDASDYERPHHASCLCSVCSAQRGVAVVR